jgi:hypothetical protein
MIKKTSGKCIEHLSHSCNEKREIEKESKSNRIKRKRLILCKKKTEKNSNID